MTDEELVKRLRGWDHCWPAQWLEGAVIEAADRIEALTAERDHAWEMAAKANTQMGQSLADNLQAKAERDEAWAYMSAAQGDLYDAIMIEAERDRLREAIMFWLEAQEPDVDAAIALMRTALKGETL